LGLPLYWMTEITHVVEGKYFIDEQRFGPYTLWHHQHHFRAVDGGVEMTDLIHYKIPLGIIGRVANMLFVRQKLNDIFNYRYEKVKELFG
jgi:ligand-binding SRPBCC domain-containing protein